MHAHGRRLTDIAAARVPGGARRPSQGSQHGLDLLAFLLPDVQAGVGPFLVLYATQVLQWKPGQIGTVITVSGVVALLAQAPAGMLVDYRREKRFLVAAGVVLVATLCVVMVNFPNTIVIAAAQSLIGAVGALLIPAIVAISIGLVGRHQMERRIGRNAALQGAGSVVFAIATGLLGKYVGIPAMFYLPAAMTAPTLLALSLIRSRDIDYRAARGADASGHRPAWKESDRLRTAARVVAIPGFAALLASTVLFHFANAAVLPLMTQRVSMLAHSSHSLYVSGLVAVNEAVLIPVGFGAGWLAARGRRRPLFMVAFLVLPIRCALCAVVDNPLGLIAIQVLDGLGAGVFTVMQVLVIADLTQGSGWFNFAQGIQGAAVAVGATLSNLVAGFVVQVAGFATGFLLLGGVAALALLLFVLAMPETFHPSVRAAAAA